jgi:hypothetical protein
MRLLRARETACPSRALYCLWRLSERTKERLAHALAISESSLAGNHLDGMVARLHHEPCRFDA